MVGSQIHSKVKILEALKSLPPARLGSVLDFVEYLKDKEETQEILSDKNLMKKLRRADRDWKGGKYKKGDYLELKEFKQNV